MFLTAMMGLVIFLVVSSLLYYAERERDPIKYSSIPATMYVALLLLTSLDVPPVEECNSIRSNSTVTTAGRIIVGFSSLISIMIIAIPYVSFPEFINLELAY